MSKRFFSDIKCLMHFDFPYVNEPNECLEEEVGIETVTRNGGSFSSGLNDAIGNNDKKFGYRAFVCSSGSYISISNNHDTFTLNPTKKYEAEAFIRLNSAPSEGAIYDIFRSDNLALTIGSGLHVNVSIPIWNVDVSSEDGVLTSTSGTWHHIVLRIANSMVKVFIDSSMVVSSAIEGNTEHTTEDFRIGGFDGYMDEFVFRHSAGNSNPVIPTQPYSGTLNVNNIGGFGNGADGSVVINEECSINSVTEITGITNARTFTVGEWDEGTYLPDVGREVMLFVWPNVKNSDYSLCGLYDFARIATLNDNEIELDRDINGDFTLDSSLLDDYYIKVYTVPNFSELTVNSTINAKQGLALFRCEGDCTISGSILSMGSGPTRYDLHQMTNAKIIDRFLIAGGGGVFIACGGTLYAPSTARIGASWSGLGDENGNGACGYGGRGGYTNKINGASGTSIGGAGGVGGGGGGSSLYASYGGSRAYIANGGVAPGGSGYSDICSSGGGGCGGYGPGGNGGSQGVSINATGIGGGGAGGQGSNYAGACIVIICKMLKMASETISSGGQHGNDIWDYMFTGTISGGGGGGTGFCYIACEGQVEADD